jgi:hypothetical protein
MDSLDRLLGSGREGLYLDAGSRSSFSRSFHLRTLDSGVLVATQTRQVGSMTFLDPGIDPDDLRPLVHRLDGEEQRVVLSLSWFAQYSGNTVVDIFQAGYEVRRGWQLLAGWGQGFDVAGSTDGKVDQLLAGVRWSPLLGYESPVLENRAVLDLDLIVPIDKQGIPTSTFCQWNAPPILQLGLVYNISIFEIGAGFQAPLGPEYSQPGLRMDFPGNAHLNLRAGIRTEWRGWRKAPSFFIHPDSRTPTTANAVPSPGAG